METPKEILKKSTINTLSINEGSPLQGAVITAMKEYASQQTTQLQKDKEELLEALESVIPALRYFDSKREEIESLIQKHKQ